MFRLGVLVAAALAVLAFAAPANAAVVTPYGGFGPGLLSGITLGADGLLWIGEETQDKLTRLSPSGLDTGYVRTGGAGGGAPASVITGPAVGGPRGSGSVWSAMTKAKEILRVDTFHGGVTRIPTTGLSDCGPKGIATGPGGAHIYFTLPNPGDGSCTSPSKIGWVSAFSLTGTAAAEGFGPALDLETAGGKLFVPDPAGGVIRRATVDPTAGAPTVDGTFPVPGGGSPRGIAATRDGGSVWVTLYDAGKVARLASAAADGTAPTVLDPGGPFAQPFGIVAGNDGFIYAASYGSARIARFAADGTPAVIPLPAGHSPWDITNGQEGDFWITNRDHRTVSRFTHGAPRPTTRAYSAAATWAFVSGTTDPMGNETQTWFEWGKTPAYGNRTEVRSLRAAAPFVPAPLPATNPVVATGTPVAVGPVTVSGELQGLEPDTEYHYRLVATNSEGTRFGEDETFTTEAGEPSARAKLARLGARVTVAARNSGSRTRITRLRVTRLVGGESVKVTCKGRGCKFSSRTRSAKKKGTMKLESLFGRRALRPGARVVVRVTKSKTIGASVSITARRSAKPRVVQRCLRPGAKSPTVC